MLAHLPFAASNQCTQEARLSGELSVPSPADPNSENIDICIDNRIP